MNLSPNALYNTLYSLFFLIYFSANLYDLEFFYFEIINFLFNFCYICLKLKPDEVFVFLKGKSKRLKEYFGRQSGFQSKLQFQSIEISITPPFYVFTILLFF